MTDLLLQIGASKLLVSAVLAGLAWLVQRRFAHPAVTHPLWLLVLVALLLPAVVSLPVLPGESAAAAVISDGAALVGEKAVGVPVGVTGHDQGALGAPFLAWITENGKAGLAIGWLAGTALLLGWTLARSLRFICWLARTSQPAPPELHREVAEVGRRLDLARMPEVHTTTARVSPMVCWTGGRVRLVIPSFLLAGLDRQELRSVLAHELAHVRRRDHLVRWMEWLACSAFWWNPAAWWARRELRSAEEASCDAIGLAAIESTPRTYAESLLRVVELMSTPPTPPAPAFASGAASGRNPKALERRLRMLVSGKSTVQAPGWIRTAGAAAAVCVLPLGLVYCGFADQPTPTALEEEPEVAPQAQSEAPSGEESAGSLSSDWEWMVRGRSMPGLTYWVMDPNDISGPHSLADVAHLPADCQAHSSEQPGETRLDASLACARALADQVKRQDDSQAWGLCVGRGGPGSGWRGNCITWRHRPLGLIEGSLSPFDARLRVDDRGSALLELITETEQAAATSSG